MLKNAESNAEYKGNYFKNSINRKFFLVKFIYSEKATKFCEISTVDLTGTTLISVRLWNFKDGGS